MVDLVVKANQEDSRELRVPIRIVFVLLRRPHHPGKREAVVLLDFKDLMADVVV